MSERQQSAREFLVTGAGTKRLLSLRGSFQRLWDDIADVIASATRVAISRRYGRLI